MFRIALCEDDAAFRQLTCDILNEYIAARGLSARVWNGSSSSGCANPIWSFRTWSKRVGVASPPSRCCSM